MKSWRTWCLAGSVLLACLAAPFSVQARPAGTITGTVFNEQGEPLTDATVVVRGLDADSRHQSATDLTGSFSVGGLSPGRYMVAFLRGGEIFWMVAATLSSAQEELAIEVNLKKILEERAKLRQLDPELERLRQEEQERRTHREKWELHYNRGLAHLRQQEPELAVEEFRAALEIDPERSSVLGRVGEALAAAGRIAEAREAYRQALAADPGEAAYHNNLGILLVESGLVDEGVAEFETAAGLDRERAATYTYNMGAALLNAARLGEAMTALRRATRSDPELAVAHYFLGLALFESSFGEAGPGAERKPPAPGTIEAFQRYLQLEPNGPFAEAARSYLIRLGAGTPELLPRLPSAELLE